MLFSLDAGWWSYLLVPTLQNSKWQAHDLSKVPSSSWKDLPSQMFSEYKALRTHSSSLLAGSSCLTTAMHSRALQNQGGQAMHLLHPLGVCSAATLP